MNINDAKQVIVISDAHGHPELIENALENAAFDASRDGLVYAGDLVDGSLGPDDARSAIALLKSLDAQFLWGNHDVAVLLDYSIDFQKPWSREHFVGAFVHEFQRDDNLRWELVVRIQGVFVSHAGLSSDYLNDYRYGLKDYHTDDPDGFVKHLNAMFRKAVQRQLDGEPRDKLNRIMGRRAPHRFRAFGQDMGPGAVLPGVTQVAGHSAPELWSNRWSVEDLRQAGLFIVDPSYKDRGVRTASATP